MMKKIRKLYNYLFGFVWDKSTLFVQFFSIKIDKTEFSFKKMDQAIQVNIRE